MVRAVIIEDEHLAAKKLKMLLNIIDDEIEVLEEIASVSDAVRWLSTNEVDLVFLDINLSDDLSFNIFEQVQIDCPIIFTTAYDQYAIKAFEQNSIAYILKPITEDDLRKALSKFSKFSNPSQQNANIESLLSTYLGTKYKSRILVNYGGKSKTISVNEVAYFYAFEKGVYLTTFSNHTYLTDHSIDELGQDLDPKSFFRINRGFITNIDAIDEIIKFSSRRLKINLNPPSKIDALVPQEKIPIFKEWLNN